MLSQIQKPCFAADFPGRGCCDSSCHRSQPKISDKTVTLLAMQSQSWYSANPTVNSANSQQRNELQREHHARTILPQCTDNAFESCRGSLFSFLGNKRQSSKRPRPNMAPRAFVVYAAIPGTLADHPAVTRALGSLIETNSPRPESEVGSALATVSIENSQSL